MRYKVRHVVSVEALGQFSQTRVVRHGAHMLDVRRTRLLLFLHIPNHVVAYFFLQRRPQHLILAAQEFHREFSGRVHDGRFHGGLHRPTRGMNLGRVRGGRAAFASEPTGQAASTSAAVPLRGRPFHGGGVQESAERTGRMSIFSV